MLSGEDWNRVSEILENLKNSLNDEEFEALLQIINKCNSTEWILKILEKILEPTDKPVVPVETSII